MNEKDISRFDLMDSGFYNECIKGYCIQAMKNAGYDREAIKDVLRGLSWALDEKTAIEAALVYCAF